MTVKTNPAGQTCTVASGSRHGRSANVTNVAVTCTANATYVHDRRDGLGLSGTVVLQDNGGDNLTVTANGAFTFATKLATGAGYAVTVKTNPAGQTCTVANGSGTIGLGQRHQRGGRPAPPIPTYTVGGTVSGLSGTVVLQDNGGDDLSVTANGAFTFATALASGRGLQRDGEDQPGRADAARWPTGRGTVGSANVTNVAVTCAANADVHRRRDGLGAVRDGGAAG